MSVRSIGLFLILFVYKINSKQSRNYVNNPQQVACLKNNHKTSIVVPTHDKNQTILEEQTWKWQASNQTDKGYLDYIMSRIPGWRRASSSIFEWTV